MNPVHGSDGNQQPGQMGSGYPGYGPYGMFPFGPGYFPSYQYQPYYGASYPPYQPMMPNGAGNPYARTPQPTPLLDGDMPSSQMNNSSGGLGCEPGYNYFFAAEHTKIHVLKSPTPPWQLPANATMPFHACHVPTVTTLAEILKGFGATNPTPKKNKCYEVVQGGGGKWYKGLCFSGDEKDMMKKQIKDIGWDATRIGGHGNKPVVCLWLSKEG